MSLEQPENFDDRRDSIRAARIVTVKHRRVQHKGQKVEGTWQVSMTENMSVSGLLFVSAFVYEQDDLVELEVVMSGMVDLFKGYGQVIRSIHHKGGHYHVAVKYVDLKAMPKSKTRSAKRIIKKPSK
jgi:hypothetical protein